MINIIDFAIVVVNSNYIIDVKRRGEDLRSQQ